MTKKLYLAITLVVILSVATAAIIFTTQTPPGKPAVPGISVGDEFIYDIKGYAYIADLDSSVPDYFDQFNATEWYKVSITAVNGSEVTFDTTWRFMNGTELKNEQTIDLGNGMKTDPDGYWAIYTSDLNASDLIRPYGADGITVNKTETRDSRETNYFTVESQFYDITDPTYGTQRYDIMYVYFDKQTGMLVELRNIQIYNNPEMTLTISWEIVDSNVWSVS
jgi:hypothetical protein